MRFTTCDKLVTAAPVTCAACRGVPGAYHTRGKPKPNCARSRCQGHPDEEPAPDDDAPVPLFGQQPEAADILDAPVPEAKPVDVEQDDGTAFVPAQPVEPPAQPSSSSTDPMIPAGPPMLLVGKALKKATKNLLS